MKKRNNLWAPWRLGYILNCDEPGCFLCRAWKSRRDEETHVVYRGKKAFAALNIFPYNNGHLLVSPAAHVKSLDDLSPAEERELWGLVKRSTVVLRKALKPHGFNIGINLGRVAGAGVEDHLHVHIVPRWNGDTNFMPVLTDSKVMPQSLSELYGLLQKEFK